MQDFILGFQGAENTNCSLVGCDAVLFCTNVSDDPIAASFREDTFIRNVGNHLPPTRLVHGVTTQKTTIHTVNLELVRVEVCSSLSQTIYRSEVTYL
jgi:hypothetical protein